MKRFLVLIGLIGLLSITSMSQKYFIDYNLGDSVDVFKIKMLEDGKTDTLDESVMKLAMGEEVEVTRLLKGQTGYGAIENLENEIELVRNKKKEAVHLQNFEHLLYLLIN